MLDLLPRELDRYQKSEHDFREAIQQLSASRFPWMDEKQLTTFLLLDYLASYPFTSQYFFFKEYFSKKYQLRGRGLEIGGAMGQASGLIKLFYPDTEMVSSDVAPINITSGEKFSGLVGLDTDYFVMADAERLPFLPGSFDFLFSSGMLHHLGNLPRALEKGYAALKPDGVWYIVNELSIGSAARLFWNSRFGQKGRHGSSTGIRERSYTYKEWQQFFEDAGFRIVDTYFHRNPKHKLINWSRSLYYAVISKIPTSLIRWGIPCEVCYVLDKNTDSLDR